MSLCFLLSPYVSEIYAIATLFCPFFFCLCFLITSKAGRWHQLRKGEFYVRAKQKDRGKKKKRARMSHCNLSNVRESRKESIGINSAKDSKSLIWNSFFSSQQTEIHKKSGFIFCFWIICLNYFELFRKNIIKSPQASVREVWKINVKKAETTILVLSVCYNQEVSNIRSLLIWVFAFIYKKYSRLAWI